jgi:hypothetical protein
MPHASKKVLIQSIGCSLSSRAGRLVAISPGAVLVLDNSTIVRIEPGVAQTYLLPPPGTSSTPALPPTASTGAAPAPVSSSSPSPSAAPGSSALDTKHSPAEAAGSTPTSSSSVTGVVLDGAIDLAVDGGGAVYVLDRSGVWKIPVKGRFLDPRLM